jgi:type VI secretion system protein ImpF
MASFGSRSRFNPTLFERLFDAAPQRAAEADPLRGWSIEELKDSVAMDLESLLNSRSALSGKDVKEFPAARASLVCYGMHDFVGRSMANPADRIFICQTLERTIALHEPRLRDVTVSLLVDEHAVNVLRFSISAVLVVKPAQEPVSFDALLQPTTQRYSVARGRPHAVSLQ